QDRVDPGAEGAAEGAYGERDVGSGAIRRRVGGADRPGEQSQLIKVKYQLTLVTGQATFCGPRVRGPQDVVEAPRRGTQWTQSRNSRHLTCSGLAGSGRIIWCRIGLTNYHRRNHSPVLN